ncbi:MAG: hypothetical protein K5893_12270 [Prevotella sp.]|nr:hypothetical protein [Prevotella sp.]
MDETVKYLKTLFWAFVILAALIVVLFESELMQPGSLLMDDQVQFGVLTLMELITIAVIPFSLYFFQLKSVKKQLTENGASALKRFGGIRLCMLGIPLVINTLLYYISGLNVAYGYMAIILLIVMPFVYPSKSRCKEDLEKKTEE